MSRVSGGDIDGYFAALKSGYRQSKCVAELLLRRARKKGLLVNVFRCGMIVGESGVSGELSRATRKGGVANESDWVSRLLCGIVHMRSYPLCKGTQHSPFRAPTASTLTSICFSSAIGRGGVQLHTGGLRC
jgi:thioester reductase-like protein